MTLHAVEAMKMKTESINELKNVEKLSADSSFSKVFEVFYSLLCRVRVPEISTDCMREQHRIVSTVVGMFVRCWEHNWSRFMKSAEMRARKCNQTNFLLTQILPSFRLNSCWCCWKKLAMNAVNILALGQITEKSKYQIFIHQVILFSIFYSWHIQESSRERLTLHHQR